MKKECEIVADKSFACVTCTHANTPTSEEFSN